MADGRREGELPASGPVGIRASRTLVTGGSGFVGTNLVAALLDSGREVTSLDVRRPLRPDHADVFLAVDIRSLDALRRAFEKVEPTEVVHLAARTCADPRGSTDYTVNTLGTANVIRVVAESAGVRRVLFTSSMVVDPPAPGSEARRRASPIDAYAQSKAAMEGMVRSDSSMKCSWCLLRPVSIWGPWFGVPFCPFFVALAEKRYWHPGRSDPPRLLGYVGNAAFQILKLLDCPAERIHGRAFYLADYEPTTTRQWAELIARASGVRPPRTLPDPLVRMLARAGDLGQALGYRNAPLTSFRLANMLRDTTGAPLEPTRDIAGPLPYSLNEGVEETVRWLRTQGLVAP